MRRTIADEGGATAVEFAFAFPVLIMLLVAGLQFGIVLHTSTGLRHALGEGIRYAKINPGLTDEAILTRTKDSLSGIDKGGITSLTYERGTENGADYGVIAVDYEVTPMIPFAPVGTIRLSESKRAYLQD
jgi:Flp pilus assembly pilin Flp